MFGIRKSTASMVSFHERKKIMVLAACVFVTVLITRGVDVMLVKGNELRQAADENRFFHRFLLPSRGIFFDRRHVPLVANVPLYAKIEGDPVAVHPQLSPIDEHTAFLLFVAEPERVVRVQERSYMYGSTLAHVLGFVGFPTNPSSVLSLNQKVGKLGLERTFDESLRGTSGTQLFEINAVGKIVRMAQVQEPQAGKDQLLSVDAALSQAAYNLIKDRSGAVVVSDVPTGQVEVLVSSPSFNPSDVANALTKEDNPLLNRALLSYPPGSVFKMMTALAALKKGVISSTSLIHDEGEIKVGQATFSNWYFSSYGKTEGDIDVVQALKRSNDVFFYKVAGATGPQEIGSMAKTFHLGQLLGIELPGEQGGTIPTPAWKEAVVGEKWYLGDTYHMGIGQGDVLVSPLQINAMTAALGRRGVWCRPTLFMDKSAECEDLEVSKENIQTVVEGMVAACSSGGTAFPFFPYNSTAGTGERVACKTGTAEHGPKDVKGKRSTHAWFTMFYPEDKPKVAITVLLESSGAGQFLEGSADAAPIAKKVWEAWIKGAKQ